MNIRSSAGFRSDMSIGMRGVRSLSGVALAIGHVRIVQLYLVGKTVIHAWRQRRADSICCVGVVGDVDDVMA